MTEQERQADLTLLQKLAEGEHAAIVQYMTHRFYAGEGEIGCEVEEIARREMLHWKWLNERIRELGGQPHLSRGEVNRSGPAIADMMRANVELEIHCAKEYEDAIGQTANPVLKRQFEHHLRDEIQHRAAFEKLVTEAEEMAEQGAPAHVPTEEEQAIIALLNTGAEHEYGAVLQYLHQSHATDDLKMSQTMLNVAMEEMKHMALFADEVAEMGGHPSVEHSPVAIENTDGARLQADIDDEAGALEMYQGQIDRLRALGRQDLADVLEYIRAQEAFHLEDFQELKKKLDEAEPGAEQEAVKAPGLTVGSLLGQQQN